MFPSLSTYLHMYEMHNVYVSKLLTVIMILVLFVNIKYILAQLLLIIYKQWFQETNNLRDLEMSVS